MLNDDKLLEALKELDVENLLWKYLEAKTGNNQVLESMNRKIKNDAISAIKNALSSVLEEDTEPFGGNM